MSCLSCRSSNINYVDMFTECSTFSSRNFEYLFYKKKLCFLHSLRVCKNVVVSSVFVHSEEYRKAYDFANVKPCDNTDKITYRLRVKFTDSIVSDMNVVQWLILAVLLLLLYFWSLRINLVCIVIYNCCNYSIILLFIFVVVFRCKLQNVVAVSAQCYHWRNVSWNHWRNLCNLIG